MVQAQIAGPRHVELARQHLVENLFHVARAFLGGAELRVGEPDAAHAVLPVQHLDLARHLGGIAIALAMALDLVVKAEMALERAAALGMHADRAVQIGGEIRKDRGDVREVHRGQRLQIECLGTFAMGDLARVVLVPDVPGRRGESVHDREHGVLAFARHHHRVGRAMRAPPSRRRSIPRCRRRRCGCPAAAGEPDGNSRNWRAGRRYSRR